MNNYVKIGEVGELSFRVNEQHIIDFADEEMPAILSTPWLIWFLEHAAREAVLPRLNSEESTVGVQVEVEHLAATPLGQQVTCTARVINSDGPLITFQLSAADQHETIARGLHRLRVVESRRLRARIDKKMSQ